jgi:hypothetical protein
VIREHRELRDLKDLLVDRELLVLQELPVLGLSSEVSGIFPLLTY